MTSHVVCSVEFRRNAGDEVVDSVEAEVLDCDNFRSFWVRLQEFEGTLIEIGEGLEVGAHR